LHIAIVVPAFNIAALLPDAIVSVLDQRHKDWSMVIVDDGSTDDTASVAADFRDHRITILRQRHAGVSAARNAGVAAVLRARPEALLFLDGDDWLGPDALAMLDETLADSPWAVAAAGRYARIGLDVSARLSPVTARGCLLEKLLTRNLFANGGHLLIRREAIEAAGPFSTDLCYGEDWEYWTRLALLGEFVAVPSAQPLLFVRERLGGAYLSRATDASAYRPAMEAIYRNPAMAARLGTVRLGALRRRADAEMAWTVGREMVRHGRRREGLGWLGWSIRIAPGLKRLLLVAMACLRRGPFRPYRTSY
jgi:glycosyltransferase involved in cell wall biosynthesis